MKRVIAVTLCAALAILGVSVLYGDHVRRLFSPSADTLAGGDGSPSQLGNPALTRKKMLNFGISNTYGESYAALPQGNTHEGLRPNGWTKTGDDPLSTFAIDVDTASYSLGRRTLLGGYLPVPEGVRVEEWVNAFSYQLPAPEGRPFSVHVEGAPSPFTEGRTLVKVSLQGRRIDNAERKPAHLVFLVDVSGSMGGPDRLGLAQQSLRLLTKQLRPCDTVALVTYANGVTDVLPPTSGEQQRTILSAIDSLSAGGGTAMSSGLEVAYHHAAKTLQPGHVSRVLVLTDGDANLGSVGAKPMLEAVKDQVKQGVTLTTVGFGMGNYRDATMEQLADRGNGQSVYIDSLKQAQKVFVEGLAGTLEVIAKDVKIQVDFDPTTVAAYRLLGYENRDVKDADFRKDDVDGGEIGAGHSVTALYEVERKTTGPVPGPLGTVFVRGMLPEAKEAFEVEQVMSASVIASSLESASTELRFAVAVAMGADLLRGNPGATGTLKQAAQLARGATRDLAERVELVSLLERAADAKPAPTQVVSNNSY